MKVDHYLMLYKKSTQKLLKDLKTTPETIKILEDKVEDKLLGIGLGKDFSDLTPKAKARKTKINKWE